jgi:hypothetical protein
MLELIDDVTRVSWSARGTRAAAPQSVNVLNEVLW